MIEPLQDIMRQWGMEPASMETLLLHPNVTKVKAEGKTFYLKRREYSSIENRMEELYLTSYLINNHLKVETPILTSSHLPYVKEGEQLYSFYEALEGMPLKEFSIDSLTKAGTNLSTLHLILKEYQCHNEVKGWEIERHVREWVNELNSESIGRRGQVILSKMRGWGTSFECLPHQIVHSDYNPGNILMQGGEVSGIIDFERILTAPRITDIGYFLAGMLKRIPAEKKDHSIKGIRFFIQGYGKHEPLTAGERRMLPAIVILFLLQHAFFYFQQGYSEASSSCMDFIEEMIESAYFHEVFQYEKEKLE
ncbi:phosphotransferase [Rossellomorea sp. SC111]|uniref:phosphotransferase enzyme family protein n=1 Tax=Rossellomorea sp. SC111 TaxID=2968985 RepID=UPI00215A22A1|nr:phosphotransferase [Rossellomorea sp. SC111]MCR8849549.1 phosphotransferase [Rossellomorea sp. SC111]